MPNFELDLSEVATERTLIPPSVYETRVGKMIVTAGNKDGNKWVNFALSLIILDPEIAELTGNDEPIVFFRGFFSFKKNSDGELTDEFDSSNSPEVGQFLKTMGYANSSVFMEGTEDAVDGYDFIKILFSNMADSCIGEHCSAKVIQKARSDDPETMINIVSKISKV